MKLAAWARLVQGYIMFITVQLLCLSQKYSFLFF